MGKASIMVKRSLLQKLLDEKYVTHLTLKKISLFDDRGTYFCEVEVPGLEGNCGNMDVVVYDDRVVFKTSSPLWDDV